MTAKFNSSGLPHDGPERAEAEQLFEDFLQGMAEEHTLLEEEQRRIEEEQRRSTYLVGPNQKEEK